MQVVAAPPPVALDDPALYINRELSWLEFNRRVIDEARDPQVPLLERLKFLAIFGSNLDEFFMVRVGGLQQKVQVGIAVGSGADRMAPREQLERISQLCHQLTAEQYAILLQEVLPALETVAYVERASTSSGLRNKETSETFPGSGGSHIVISGAGCGRYSALFV